MTFNTQIGFEIIYLTGPFDAFAVDARKAEFEALSGKVKKGVVLNMAGVTFLDSSGVGALVFLFKRLAANGCTLSLVGLQNQPLRLIKLLRIDRTIKTHLNMDEFSTSLVNTQSKGV